MTIKKAQIIYNGIYLTKLINLKNELLETATRYASVRTEWYFMSEDEKRSNNELRTRVHNCLIDDCNILSREMLKAGENADWRVELGNDRKEIGDFACYVYCLLGLTNR